MSDFYPGVLRVARHGAGTSSAMLLRRLGSLGVRGWHLHLLSLASIGLCIALWIRAKTVDQDERGNAERRALFVGLWPPMFWLMGDSLGRAQSRRLPWRG
jgi:hypothetical protein